MLSYWLDALEQPHVSIDIDGTIALSLEALCVAVNSACGTSYDYFDMQGFGAKEGNFADNPQAMEWAKTLLDWNTGPKEATVGFYKAMPPDFAAIAAVQAMYTAGVYVHVSTHRDLPLQPLCEWWLAKWQVPYHELHVGDYSKEVLAEKYALSGQRICFVDDETDLPDVLKNFRTSFVYLLRRPGCDVADDGDNYRVVDVWQDILDDLNVPATTNVPQLTSPLATKAKSCDAASLCVLAKDTGRVLMLQRSITDKKGNNNNAAGKWEFPGGGKDDDDASLFDTAKREWEEETGCTAPSGTLAATIVNKKNGYQTFVYVIAHEAAVDLTPDGDNNEVIAFWRIKHARHLHLRPEMDNFDWGTIKDVRDGKINKSFGDAGNTQTRVDHGEFGPGSGRADVGVAGAHTRGGGLNPDAVVGNAPGNTLDENGVLHATNINDAITALSLGVKVDFTQPRMVSTLLEELGTRAQDAAAGKIAYINLEDISVNGTNLFSHPDDINLARIEMPQFTKSIDEVTAGSFASTLTPDAHGNVDLGPHFEDWLKSNGATVTQTTEDAQYLHATQNEINASKVGALMNGWDSSRARGSILVSSDNYILDGHNGWAAQVGLEFRDGNPITMGVSRVSLPMTELLPQAIQFATMYGIPPASGTDTTTKFAYMMALLKSYGDEGNTQQRVDHGHFGPASGGPVNPIRTAEVAGTNSALLSRAEYAHVQAQGRALLDARRINATPAAPVTQAMVDHAYNAVQQSWGGAAFDAHTGALLTPNTGYSVTIRNSGNDSVILSENAAADPTVFAAAMAEASTRFADELSLQGASLGVFHDDTKGTVEIDPSMILPTQAQSDAVGSVTHATGGAYSFADGNGYWPPHVKFAYLAMLLKSFGDDNNTQIRDDHGRFGPAQAGTVHAFNQFLFTKEEQQKIIDKQIALGVSPQKVAENMQAILDRAKATMTPAEYEAAKNWYQTEHDNIVAIADQYGIDHERAFAIVASLSPQCSWDRDMVLAQTVMALQAVDPVVGPNGEHWSEMSTQDAVKAFGFGSLSKPLETAVDIARGASIDDRLHGDKVRSFYTNLSDPTRDGVATIDGHQMGLMLQGIIPGTEYSSKGQTFAGTALNATTVRGMTGGYAFYAQEVIDAGTRNGLQTNQAQAISWVQWNNEHYVDPTSPAGRKEVTLMSNSIARMQAVISNA